MSKKILYILALFSFLNFGFGIKTSFAVDNDTEKVISDQSNKSLEELLDELLEENVDINLEEIDFLDIDLDNTEKNIKIKTPGLKEKLSLLAEILKGMTIKEKISFISIILKSQIKEHKKEVITTATVLTGATAAIIIICSKNKKKGK